MPLRNRVDPWGELHDDPSKAGTLMGNRGILHNQEGAVVKKWVGKAWVACDPKFKGIDRRPLFQPGRYSELFFLDEATSLSAGHRPCAYCQRTRFNDFKSRWHRVFMRGSDARLLRVTDIDAFLHGDRVTDKREKKTFIAEPHELPDGAIFEFMGQARLVHKGRHLLWSHEGYSFAELVPANSTVAVLTPKSIVQLYSTGYAPSVHASADA